MTQPLPLGPVSTLLPPGPFTPAQARAAGLDRPGLERLLQHGAVRRVRRGVYAAADLPDTVATRAAALALVVRPGRVVVDRTAGWLHGVLPDPGAPALAGNGRRLAARDVQRVGDVLVTTALRTAVDLGRTLPGDEVLPVLDAFLRSGLQHAGLLGQVAALAGQPGVTQLRRWAPLADGRAADRAESVLRLRWLQAELPTPLPGLVAGGRRLVLGLPVHRFGVAWHDIALPDWRVLALHPARVLRADGELLGAHLRREFHRALLRDVG